VDKNDLIIVTPWYLGISFERYYRGHAPWVTIPPIEFHTFHRFDLVKRRMLMPDQNEVVRPVIDKSRATLKSGHRVWAVGLGSLLPPGLNVPAPPPAPGPATGWLQDPYNMEWSAMTLASLQACARHPEVVSIGLHDPVSRLEDIPVMVFDGWVGP